MRRLRDRRAAGAGLEVEEDGAGPEAGSECGNLLARVPAAAAAARATASAASCCARTWTRSSSGADRARGRRRRWQNANEGILGPTEQARGGGCSLEVAAARRGARLAGWGWSCCSRCARRTRLRGARRSTWGAWARLACLRLRRHASALGEGRGRLAHLLPPGREFRGAAAHAAPGRGRRQRRSPPRRRRWPGNAAGRLDEETTGPRGRIEGGRRTLNVVPDAAGSRPRPGRWTAGKGWRRLIAEMVDTCTTAANRPPSATSTWTCRALFSAIACGRRRWRWRRRRARCARAGTSRTGSSPAGDRTPDAFEAPVATAWNLARDRTQPTSPTRAQRVAAEGMLDMAWRCSTPRG